MALACGPDEITAYTRQTAAAKCREGTGGWFGASMHSAPMPTIATDILKQHNAAVPLSTGDDSNAQTVPTDSHIQYEAMAWDSRELLEHVWQAHIKQWRKARGLAPAAEYELTDDALRKKYFRGVSGTLGMLKNKTVNLFKRKNQYRSPREMTLRQAEDSVAAELKITTSDLLRSTTPCMYEKLDCTAAVDMGVSQAELMHTYKRTPYDLACMGYSTITLFTDELARLARDRPVDQERYDRALFGSTSGIQFRRSQIDRAEQKVIAAQTYVMREYVVPFLDQWMNSWGLGSNFCIEKGLVTSYITVAALGLSPKQQKELGFTFPYMQSKFAMTVDDTILWSANAPRVVEMGAHPFTLEDWVHVLQMPQPESEQATPELMSAHEIHSVSDVNTHRVQKTLSEHVANMMVREIYKHE